MTISIHSTVVRLAFSLLGVVLAVRGGFAGAPAPADATAKAAASAPGEHEAAAVAGKFRRFAERTIAKYDRDGNGVLKGAELQAAPEAVRQAPRDAQGRVGVDELAEHLAAYARTKSLRRDAQTSPNLPEFAPLLHPSTPANPAGVSQVPGSGKPEEKANASAPQANRQTRERRFHVSPSQLPPGLPDWFLQRDADGDGQLTLSEFAPSGAAATAAEFLRYDLNHDGLVTPQEVLQVVRPTKAAPAPKAVSKPAKRGT
jgi:hypothetical protein